MVSGCSLFPGSSEIEREAKRAHLLRVRSEGAGDELRLTAHLQPVQHLYRVTITAPGFKKLVLGRSRWTSGSLR
jgi:6-phosphogluconolactonase/glucosamine-6-phosphate isomerase/deaminase